MPKATQTKKKKNTHCNLLWTALRHRPERAVKQLAQDEKKQAQLQRHITPLDLDTLATDAAERLRELLIPFSPKKLANDAPLAVELLNLCPFALSGELLRDLVRERPLVNEETDEDKLEHFSPGFGANDYNQHKLAGEYEEVTSYWSEWCTFRSDNETWSKDSKAWIKYTVVRGNEKTTRVYSPRAAVVVLITKLVCEYTQVICLCL